MVTVNHMTHDVAEVNSSDPPMLPGSFLYEKEPGYEARDIVYTRLSRRGWALFQMFLHLTHPVMFTATHALKQMIR